MSESTTASLDIAANLRRLMARRGLTLCDVVQRSGLDERTIKRVLAARCRPHARTLHKLALGLEVPADELLQTSAGLAHRRFDRQTNPLVQRVVSDEPALFSDWTPAEFDELYSRFGTGGALTEEGIRQTAERMNLNREVHRQVAVILESDQSDLLVGVVGLLYHKASAISP